MPPALKGTLLLLHQVNENHPRNESALGTWAGAQLRKIARVKSQPLIFGNRV